MTKLELWGLEEVADALGISVNTAYAWRHRGKLPAPEWIVSGRPIWRASKIRAWLKSR